MGTLKRPANLARQDGRARQKGRARQEGRAETVEVSPVEVREVDAPPGAEPILWRLLTPHGVEDADGLGRVVGWHRQRQAISSNSSAP